jgi:hypothetical protein
MSNTAEIVIILLLVLLNGFFSGAEIAILTARRGRLEQLAKLGDRGAKLALLLSLRRNAHRGFRRSRNRRRPCGLAATIGVGPSDPLRRTDLDHAHHHHGRVRDARPRRTRP